MKAIIFCQNISIETIEEAFTLGDYQNSDIDILSIPYKLYRKENNIIIEFEEAFDFSQMLFVVADLLEISRNDSRDVLAYVNTHASNKITEFLKGASVCLYLSEVLKLSLRMYPDSYIDEMNYVTASNKNYSIDMATFFSYKNKEKRNYEASHLQYDDHEFIKRGEYLYEKGDHENEYLEDLKRRS